MNQSHKMLHDRLMDAAIYAASHGRIDKLVAIVEGLVESAIRKKVTIWLHNFTVATADPADPLKFKYSKKAKIYWSEIKARENPFWDIRLKSKTASPIFTDKSPAATNLTTECIIAKRQIKSAFERFLKNPNLDSKENLILMLKQYHASCGQANNDIKAKFVAGGLPSLGNKR